MDHIRLPHTKRSTLLAMLALVLFVPPACIQGDLFGDDPDRPQPVEPEQFPPEAFPDAGPSFEFVPTTPLERANPPALSGGTLGIARDGITAVVSDPARDLVYVVNTETGTLTAKIELDAGAEPGRVAFDDAGQAWVALRRAGAVIAFDHAAPSPEIAFHAVCAAPRGLAWNVEANEMLVGCLDGRIFALDTNGDVARMTLVDHDVRDVTVDDAGIVYVTRMRSAELLVLDSNLNLQERKTFPDTRSFDFMTGEERNMVSTVAWQTTASPGGGVTVTHQRATDGPVHLETEGGYGGDPCGGGIIQSGVSTAEPGADPLPTAPIAFSTLPVDSAFDGNGDLYIVAGGNSIQNGFGVPNLLWITQADVERESLGEGDCVFPEMIDMPNSEARATSVAFTASGRLVVQSREPAELYIGAPNHRWDWDMTVELDGKSVANTGFDVFHTATGGGLACASCHPGGADDGHVWNFDPIGPRATQTLHGGIMDTAPFHWDGDMDTIETLMGEVLTGRMSGAELNTAQVNVLASWLDTLQAPMHESLDDPMSVERGRLLYFDLQSACATCHQGDQGIDKNSLDVGTGKTFQVPTLIGLANRENFMHDGCADTLHERFTNEACGGGDRHGTTSHLNDAQIDDLVAYLKTL